MADAALLEQETVESIARVGAITFRDIGQTGVWRLYPHVAPVQAEY